MFENMSQSEKKSFIYTIIGFVIIFSIFFAIIIMFSMKAEQANFEVIEEGQYIKMDYDPRPFIDAQWTFSFHSFEQTVGSGQYEEEIYPFIVYWKFYFQGVHNNRPIAEKYYVNNATWVHPGQEISFKHSFYSYEYEKGQYLAKLRVELVAFINDEPTTLYDSIDFLIEVRGSATPGEIAAIIIPTVLIALFILLTYLLQRFLNKRLYETITFANAWLFLPIYLQRKKSQSNRTMIPYDPNFAADFAATCQGLLLPEKFKNRYFPPLKEENNNEA